ncbi:hypothetical protein ACQRD6_05055 [Prevotella sp. SGI.027]|nr:hypothetical protein [Prevotella sp.]
MALKATNHLSFSTSSLTKPSESVLVITVTTVLADISFQLAVMYLVLPILVMPNKRNIFNDGDMLLRHQ